MENTGLTMGRDKNVPLRVLVLGFGLLFVQLGAASLAALLGYQRISAGWGITLRSKLKWDVGNLSSLMMPWKWGCLSWPPSARQRKEETYSDIFKPIKKSRQTFSRCPQSSPSSAAGDWSPWDCSEL